MQIERGQRIKLADVLPAGNQFSLNLNIDSGGLNVDISCFGVDANSKLSDERYMTFFNQPRTPCGGVVLDEKRFIFDLDKLPSSINALVIALAIDGQGDARKLGSSVLQVISGAVVVATHHFDGSAYAAERAIKLIEFYRKEGAWRVNAVGQGFNGGLDALIVHFGGEVAPTVDARSPVAATPPVTPSLSSAKKPISLSKVTLDKAKPRVSLEKKTEGFGEIRINLNWNRGQAPASKSGGLLGGLFGGGNKGVDLDVGCLYEQRDGTISAIQSLGNRFGSFRSDPFIELKGDDRTGAISEGEWLHINGQHWQTFKRILVYAFIYEGAPNWAQTDGIVTIYIPNEAPLEIRLTEGSNSLGMCAVVLLENVNGALQVNREVRYFKGHQEMDQAYRWGLNWRAGSK